MPDILKVDDIKPGDQLIDVRTQTEFAVGHIAGALNIPLETVELRVNDMDAVRPVVLVCKAGTRAQTAARILAHGTAAEPNAVEQPFQACGKTGERGECLHFEGLCVLLV